jgi:serine protease Do
MVKFAGIAAGLTLASGVVLAAGGAQAPQTERHAAGQGPGAWVAREAQADGGGQTLTRRLRVLAGRGVELGVTIRDVGSDAPSVTGAVVDEVRAGSPADKAGIKQGDVIAEFDGERVRSARQLSRLVGETPEGRTVKAGIVRDGKRMDVSVTPESGVNAGNEFEHEFVMPPPGDHFERGMPGPDARHFFFDTRPPGGGEGPEWFSFEARRGRLGVGIEDLSPQLAKYFGATDGVLVTTVEPDSPAAKAGLRAGDVITSVNGKAVSGASTLIEAVHGADQGGALTIDYLRDKKAGTTTATLAAPERPKIRTPAEPI